MYTALNVHRKFMNVAGEVKDNLFSSFLKRFVMGCKLQCIFTKAFSTVELTSRDSFTKLVSDSALTLCNEASDHGRIFKVVHRSTSDGVLITAGINECE